MSSRQFNAPSFVLANRMAEYTQLVITGVMCNQHKTYYVQLYKAIIKNISF